MDKLDKYLVTLANDFAKIKGISCHISEYSNINERINYVKNMFKKSFYHNDNAQYLFHELVFGKVVDFSEENFELIKIIGKYMSKQY